MCNFWKAETKLSNTGKKYLRRAGRTFTFQRHRDKNASSSIAYFFFSPLKSDFWKDVPSSQLFFSCAYKNIIWVCQKSFNLAIFIVRCPLICNKASTCRDKFYTHTIKSSQCISTEDNFLSVFQSSKSFSVSFIQASLLETKFQGKTTTPARDLIPPIKTQAHQLITGDSRCTQNCLEL